MKFLKDNEHAALTASAQNYAAIIAAAKEADPTLDENASAEDLIAAITSGGNAPEQAEEIATLSAAVKTQTEEIAALQTQLAQKDETIKTLSAAPAAPAPKIDAKQEPAAVAVTEDPIEAIGKMHADDPNAMVAAMKKEGII